MEPIIVPYGHYHPGGWCLIDRISKISAISEITDQTSIDLLQRSLDSQIHLRLHHASLLDPCKAVRGIIAVQVNRVYTFLRKSWDS